jgi:hypothetical protein
MIETKTINIANLQPVDESPEIERSFIESIKALEIIEIEPLFDEDIKILGNLKKYEFLAFLRDVFLKFKEMTDTEIIVQEGDCGVCGLSRIKTKYTMIKPIRKVIELKGNNSGEKFHFAILGKKSDALKLRLCHSFVDKEGKKHSNNIPDNEMFKFVNDRKYAKIIEST